jgi:polyisoprenoid-binding protein YceI
MSTWNIDTTHTTLEFSARHMMITTVKGRFSQVEGKIEISDAGLPAVEASIPVASIDTGVDQRDAHLRSPDFLNADAFPTIGFRSTSVEGSFANSGDTFSVKGDLSIRGGTHPVALEVTYEGEGQDPWGGTRRSFTARGVLDRRDFGLTWNQALETGGVLVSNDVKLAFDIQVVKAS